jgi:hypothetical protein
MTLTDLAVSRRGDVMVGADLGVWRYRTTGWNLVVNGDFEGEGGWELPETPWPAAYSGRVVYAGRRSMRVGLDDGPNLRAYSSARQVVTLPADATRAVLQVYVYAMSGETGAAAIAQSAAFPQDVAADEALRAMAAGDAQYLLLLDPDTGQIVQTLFWQLSNAQGWQARTFDLTPYAGRSIVLHFGVYNDGLGGRAGMYVDDVALVVERPPVQGPALPVYLPLILSQAPGALSELAIAGPSSGAPGLAYTFTATAGPDSAAQPITYAWRAGGQPPITHTGGLSDTVSFTWQVTGTQAMTLTAGNPAGAITVTHRIAIQ